MERKYSMTTVKKDCFQRCVLENADPVEEGPRSQKGLFSQAWVFKALPADTKKRDELKNRGVR